MTLGVKNAGGREIDDTDDQQALLDSTHNIPGATGSVLDTVSAHSAGGLNLASLAKAPWIRRPSPATPSRLLQRSTLARCTRAA